MEGFACIGTAALALQMGENRAQKLFVQYSCWKIINILIASSFISESFSEYSKLLFLEKKKQSCGAVSQLTQWWEQGGFWGEEEDRKFPQVLQAWSASPPCLKAEDALRSFTNHFSAKNNCKKSFCCLQPSHFPELKHLHQAEGWCPAEMLQHFLPQPGQKVHEKMGYSRWVGGPQGSVRDHPGWGWDGNVRVCAGNSWY